MIKLDPVIQQASGEDVQKAVQIIASECFGAMRIANAMGGVQTVPWQIVHNNSWADIVAEAKARGLKFEEMKCAVTDTPLTRSATYQYAAGLISDADRKRIFWASVKKTGTWPEEVAA